MLGTLRDIFRQAGWKWGIGRMQFLVVLHTETHRTDYGVTVPDLPGCVSAGDTLEQALANAGEAILGHLEVMVEDGRPVPEPNSMVPPLGPGQMIGAVKVDLPNWRRFARRSD